MKWVVVAMLALVLAGCEDPHANETCVEFESQYQPPTYIQSGNVLVPVGGGYEDVCVKWEPK